MVECCGLPGIHRVAQHTIRRERPGNMIRICRGVEICLMTIDAVRMQPRILVVDMALLAKDGTMRANQWERCIVVRKCRRLPCICRMARDAEVRESSRGMVGALNGEEIRCVTGITILRSIFKIVVPMAFRARHRTMRPG
jgi:hypothetical protein